MKKTIKTNKLKIIKLNNKTYIPFQLHQLPSYYNKNLDQFNLKGYIYINKNDLKNFNINKFKSTLVFHKTLNYKHSR